MQRVSSLYTRHWYRYLVSCKPWQRYTIVGIFLSTVCTGWFFALYCPLVDACRSYEQQLETLHKECHTCATVSKMTEPLEQSITVLQKKLKAYTAFEAPPALVCVHCAQEAGLSLHSCIMGQTTTYDQQRKVLVTIEVSGSLDAYTKFLTLLSNSPYLIMYDALHIEYAHAQQIHATATLGFVTFM